jgi:7-carboxy-7-deazaguanine synthase
MKIAEIFTSIQGESTFCGFPCTFIRVTGCNLRCRYCDTPYAFEEGEELKLNRIISEVREAGISLVELTGGEPLLQEECHLLMKLLLEEGYSVLLETNGSIPLEKIDSRVVKIMDIKCPSSGMSDHMDLSNIACLDRKDEVKFVVGDRGDFDWARGIIDKYRLIEKCKVLISPVSPKLEAKEIAGWILEEKLPVRLQLQLHKFIWPELSGGA